MNTAILFRNSIETEDEITIARKYFDVYEYRSEIPAHSLVIGRYSVLPFYKELEDELILVRKSRLINSYQQHNYIADLCNWYEDLKEFTPKTYINWMHLKDGEYIVKGKTNSRKHRWNTHMYANGRANLLKVISNLLDDCMIAEQGLVVRDYVPLAKITEGINGLPITKEWRCFCLEDKILATGFYWSNFEEYSPGNLPQKGLDFLKKVVSIVGKKTNFYVVDVAEKQTGDYMVVELNDGMMSGLSCVDPNELYKNLSENMC